MEKNDWQKLHALAVARVQLASLTANDLAVASRRAAEVFGKMGVTLNDIKNRRAR